MCARAYFPQTREVTDSEPIFLTVDEVFQPHDDQLRLFGPASALPMTGARAT